MMRDLILKNRSYRRFDASVRTEEEQLLNWIDLARLSGSARNSQPLKYAIAVRPDVCSDIFPLIGWAGYLKDWNGPVESERPTAYIAVLKDTSISENHYCDDGIAMQSILLGATEAGFGGCMLGSINRIKLAEIFKLPSHLEVLWLIALGKPVEDVRIEPAGEDIKYWRDENEIHHVPKRSMEDIVVNKK